MLNVIAKSACVAGTLALASTASADTTLSDFSSVTLSGTYVQWDSGTFTSNATNFSIDANDFGGGFFTLGSTVDATGETDLAITLDVVSGNVADKMNIVLIDADGTERVYRFEGLNAEEANGFVTLSKGVGDFLQDNAAGTTPGLDLSMITTFHLQGTFENGDPGQRMLLDVDHLALVPEPASALLGLAGLALVATRRRR